MVSECFIILAQVSKIKDKKLNVCRICITGTCTILLTWYLLFFINFFLGVKIQNMDKLSGNGFHGQVRSGH